jgi:cell division protein FtsA
VERDMGVEYEEAEAMKLGLSTNKLPAQKRPAVEKALQKTADVWIGGIELALSEFTKLDHLPHRLFLCGGGSSLDLLMDRLEKTEWYKALPFTRKPTVHHIQPTQVADIVDKTGDVTDHTFITAMGLLRVGMDTLQFSSGASGSIKDKIDKMLSV